MASKKISEMGNRATVGSVHTRIPIIRPAEGWNDNDGPPSEWFNETVLASAFTGNSTPSTPIETFLAILTVTSPADPARNVSNDNMAVEYDHEVILSSDAVSLVEGDPEPEFRFNEKGLYEVVITQDVHAEDSYYSELTQWPSGEAEILQIVRSNYVELLPPPIQNRVVERSLHRYSESSISISPTMSMSQIYYVNVNVPTFTGRETILIRSSVTADNNSSINYAQRLSVAIRKIKDYGVGG